MNQIRRPLLGAPWDKRVTLEWLTANQDAPARPFNEDVDYDLVDEINNALLSIYIQIMDSGLVASPLGGVYALSKIDFNFPTKPSSTLNSLTYPQGVFGYPLIGYGTVAGTNGKLSSNRAEYYVVPIGSNRTLDTSGFVQDITKRMQPHYSKFTVKPLEGIIVDRFEMYFSSNVFANPQDDGSSGPQYAMFDISIETLGKQKIKTFSNVEVLMIGQSLRFVSLNADSLALPQGQYLLSYTSHDRSPSETNYDGSNLICTIVPGTSKAGDVTSVSVYDTPAIFFDNRLYEYGTDALLSAVTNNALGFVIKQDAVMEEGSIVVDNGVLTATGQTRIWAKIASAPIGSVLNAVVKQIAVIELEFVDTGIELDDRVFSIEVYDSENAITTKVANFLQNDTQAMFVKPAGEEKYRLQYTDMQVASELEFEYNTKYRIELEFRYDIAQVKNTGYYIPGPTFAGYHTFLRGLYRSSDGQYLAGGPGVVWADGEESLKNIRPVLSNPRFALLTPQPVAPQPLTYWYDGNYITSKKNRKPGAFKIHSWIELREG